MADIYQQILDEERARLDRELPGQAEDIAAEIASRGGSFGGSSHTQALLSLQRYKQDKLSVLNQQLLMSKLEEEERQAREEKERKYQKELAKRQQMVDMGTTLATILTTPSYEQDKEGNIKSKYPYEGIFKWFKKIGGAVGGKKEETEGIPMPMPTDSVTNLQPLESGGKIPAQQAITGHPMLEALFKGEESSSKFNLFPTEERPTIQLFGQPFNSISKNTGGFVQNKTGQTPFNPLSLGRSLWETLTKKKKSNWF